MIKEKLAQYMTPSQRAQLQRLKDPKNRGDLKKTIKEQQKMNVIMEIAFQRLAADHLKNMNRKWYQQKNWLAQDRLK